MPASILVTGSSQAKTQTSALPEGADSQEEVVLNSRIYPWPAINIFPPTTKAPKMLTEKNDTKE